MKLTGKQILDKRLDYIFRFYTQQTLSEILNITQWELLQKMKDDSFTDDERLLIEETCDNCQSFQSKPIPKSAKETLYNSLMQSWQKINAFDHEEKNNHILIAESYGLDELVKYFNDTIDE